LRTDLDADGSDLGFERVAASSRREGEIGDIEDRLHVLPRFVSREV